MKMVWSGSLLRKSHFESEEEKCPRHIQDEAILVFVSISLQQPKLSLKILKNTNAKRMLASSYPLAHFHG